ncbi:PH domain-containing protein [Actinomycetaceae bacterium Sa1BUA1]|uniref:PH domain-containing protein n=1 Tax=Oceanitalea stevensii TaxID=2763072 RepID=A0ABR8Z2P0_9MICO|nr:PH domain-containing protein [Oceanitalea stevensii]
MDGRVEWRVFSPRQRRARQAFLVVMLVLFAVSFTFDIDGATRVVWALLVLSSLGMVVTGRAGTVADTDGVEVCDGLRTRRVPWAAVEDVRAVRSQWEDPKVEIHLTDGATRTLPSVGADAVSQLEQLRATGMG